MRGGQLRKRLDIQNFTATSKDAHGNPVKVWTVENTRWGKIEPLTGKEFELAGANTSRLTHKITIRYYKGLSVTQRIVYNPTGLPSRIFNIKSITNKDERNVQHELMCTEGLPNG